MQNWTWTGGHGPKDGGWELVDLFGDGRQVFYTHNSSGTHYATRLNPDGTVQNWTWTGGYAKQNGGWRMANLFGDGKKVFYSIKVVPATQYQNAKIVHYITVMNEDGTKENYTQTTNTNMYNRGWDVADIYGDGREMLVMANSDGKIKLLRLNLTLGSPGGSEAYNTTLNVSIGSNQKWRLVDLLGDGKKYFYTKLSGNQHYAARLWSLKEWTWSGGQSTLNEGWEVGDLFGDGRNSFYTHSSSGTHAVARFSSAQPDLMTGVTNGLGHHTEISYAPLTDDSPDFYTKGDSATYPTRDIKLPLYMVQEVVQDDGIGGDITETYQYTGAQVDLDGRGFLGFESVARYNDARQITTTIDYEQDWPYTGSVAKIEVDASGTLIKRVTNTFNHATLGGGSLYFPYLSSKLEESWDLNSTALPTQTTTYDYDCALPPRQLLWQSPGRNGLSQ